MSQVQSTPSPGLTVVPRKRRTVEMLLLIFASALSVAAYVQVDLNVLGEVPQNLPFVAGLAFGVPLLANFAMR